MSAPTNVLPFRAPVKLADRGPAPLTRTRIAEPPAPRIVTTDPWWHCQAFCDPEECTGGELYDYGDFSVVRDRRHVGVLLNETVANLDGGYTDVTVTVFALEDPEAGFPEGAAVQVNLGNVETADLDAVRRIAVALESAAWHAAQPLSPRSSSLPSLGGDRASTQEAS